jgi:hypothetical protein
MVDIVGRRVRPHQERPSLPSISSLVGGMWDDERSIPCFRPNYPSQFIEPRGGYHNSLGFLLVPSLYPPAVTSYLLRRLYATGRVMGARRKRRVSNSPFFSSDRSARRFPIWPWQNDAVTEMGNPI